MPVASSDSRRRLYRNRSRGVFCFFDTMSVQRRATNPAGKLCAIISVKLAAVLDRYLIVPATLEAINE